MDPAGQYWSPYIGMGNNPTNRMDPDGGTDGPRCTGNCDYDPSKDPSFHDHNIVIRPSIWSSIWQDVSLMLSGKWGVRFQGSGANPNVFGGSDSKGKVIQVINVEQMLQSLGLHHEWNKPGGSRYDPNQRKNVNPNQPITDAVGKLNEAMKAGNGAYEAAKNEHEKRHGSKYVVQKLKYGPGINEYVLDTLDGWTSEEAARLGIDSVVSEKSLSRERRSELRGQARKQKK
jgi:hypothetical protein